MSGLLGVIAIGVFAISVVFPAAFGHHPGDYISLPEPISYDGMEVTVSVRTFPDYLAVDSFDDVILKVRLFDTLTNTTLEQVTYRVEIWKNQDLLARSLFYDDDGQLYIEISPQSDCNESDLWRCTIYDGSEHALAPGALYVFGIQCNDDNLDVCKMPSITGPIFDRGGLYNIRIDIDGMHSPRTLVTELLSYNVFVTISQEYDFLIQTEDAEEIPIVVKTYYDDVENFHFDTTDNSINFDMPFDWDPGHIDKVRLVREEVRVPKSFAPFAEDKQIHGYVNGVKTSQRTLLVDPYNNDVTNIFHLLLANAELDRINESLGPDNYESKIMNLKFVPFVEVEMISADFYLVDSENFERVPTNVTISYDGSYGVDQEIPFEFAFFNEYGEPITDIRYAYTVFDESGQEIARNGYDDSTITLGIVAAEGSDIQNIYIPSPDTIRVDVLVYGVGFDYTSKYSGTGSAFLKVSDGFPLILPQDTLAPSIPDWVKTAAGWWADGTLDDDAFILGIQFLIANNIIHIPETDVSSSPSNLSAIPDWVRTNAGWWADGTLDDDDVFIQTIQFLIRLGVIVA